MVDVGGNTAEVALIVGGGPGVSASCARLFSGDGMRVAVAARNPEKTVLKKLASEFGVHCYACDARDPDSVAQLFVAQDQTEDVVLNLGRRAGLPGYHANRRAEIRHRVEDELCFILAPLAMGLEIVFFQPRYLLARDCAWNTEARHGFGLRRTARVRVRVWRRLTQPVFALPHLARVLHE